MNQILSVETPKKGGNSKKASVHSIVMVFAIFLLLFGIGMTSTGVYSYYKSISNKEDENSLPNSTNARPKITIDRESSSNIKIVVTHDKEIANVTYTLNDEETVQIEGNGKSEIEEKVELPTGNTTINITATDINGASSSYETSFDVEQKPTIQLEQVEGKIQITAESTINIDYILYYWDDDEENSQQYTINDIKNVTLVDVLEGTHTLNVKVVDIEGNETTKTQKIIGVNKPTVEVTSDGESFIIKASDDQEITKIEMQLNSGEVQTIEVNAKEYNGSVELEQGVNKFIIIVYNNSGLSETAKVKYTKE